MSAVWISGTALRRLCVCRESLEELNISWCRGVPEPWLGVLADACICLRKLTVFGCSQVGSSLGSCFCMVCQVSVYYWKACTDATITPQ